jgi:dTMP kinase
VRGTFIAFEGPEGGGKTVQIQRLARRLQEEGREVVVTREPGGTRVGDEIRTILLGLGDYAILPETEVLLLAAGRAQHVREVIEPALARGAWVLCDRYVDSTYAYQGGGRELDLEPIRQIQEYATGGLEPDVRVLLDLPVEAGLARRHADPDSVNRIDLDSLAFHRRVRSTYRRLADQRSSRWVVVDAMEPIESVEQSIWTQLQAALTANGIS